jgi:hypothetical protein
LTTCNTGKVLICKIDWDNFTFSVLKICFCQYTVFWTNWLIFCFLEELICNKSNTTGATCGAGTACPSGAHEFTPVFREIRVAWSLVSCVMFCRSLFVPFLFVISVLRFTASAYPFGILVKYAIYLQYWELFSVSTQCIGQLNWFSAFWNY